MVSGPLHHPAAHHLPAQEFPQELESAAISLGSWFHSSNSADCTLWTPTLSPLQGSCQPWRLPRSWWMQQHPLAVSLTLPEPSWSTCGTVGRTSMLDCPRPRRLRRPPLQRSWRPSWSRLCCGPPGARRRASPSTRRCGNMSLADTMLGMLWLALGVQTVKLLRTTGCKMTAPPSTHRGGEPPVNEWGNARCCSQCKIRLRQSTSSRLCPGRCSHPRHAAACVVSLLVRTRCFMSSQLLLQAAYGAGLPFPLNYILPYTQRRRVQRLLKHTNAEKVCVYVRHAIQPGSLELLSL